MRLSLFSLAASVGTALAIGGISKWLQSPATANGQAKAKTPAHKRIAHRAARVVGKVEKKVASARRSLARA